MPSRGVGVDNADQKPLQRPWLARSATNGYSAAFMSEASELEATGGVRRDALGRVVGGALNPTGRPKGDRWFRELCRKRTRKALKALTDALADEDGKIRVSAAKALLEFGWGRAPAAGFMPPKEDAASAADPLEGLSPAEIRALASRSH